MLFRRKKRSEDALQKPVPPLARLINIAIVGFVGYAFYTGMTAPNAPVTDVRPSVAENSSVDALPMALRYIDAAQVPATRHLSFEQDTRRFRTLKAGSGSPATCGQRVALQLQVTDTGTAKPIVELADSLAKQIILPLGRNNTPRDALLHALVIGLGVGGEREIVTEYDDVLRVFMPGMPRMANAQPDGTSPASRAVTLSARVKNISPALPANAAPMTVIEKDYGTDEGQAYCGRSVRLSMEIWHADGRPWMPAGAAPRADVPAVPTPLIVTATLGRGQLPFAIERAVEGMGQDGVRMALLPPAWRAPFAADAEPLPAVMPDLPNEFLLAEIKLLEPEAASPSTQSPAATHQTPNVPKQP